MLVRAFALKLVLACVYCGGAGAGAGAGAGKGVGVGVGAIQPSR